MSTTTEKLKGKVGVITGGTSGIGLAVAQRFVVEGAYVFITGRRKDALDAAVASQTRTGHALLHHCLRAIVVRGLSCRT